MSEALQENTRTITMHAFNDFAALNIVPPIEPSISLHISSSLQTLGAIYTEVAESSEFSWRPFDSRDDTVRESLRVRAKNVKELLGQYGIAATIGDFYTELYEAPASPASA